MPSLSTIQVKAGDSQKYFRVRAILGMVSNGAKCISVPFEDSINYLRSPGRRARLDTKVRLGTIGEILMKDGRSRLPFLFEVLTVKSHHYSIF
jgi:hypothetical protein